MRLATLSSACLKDFYYDSGYDCPNIVGLGAGEGITLDRVLTDEDTGTSYNLSSWNVEGYGSFWLADLANADGSEALRVTYSCGNNHASNVCNKFYPLCTTN